MRLWRSLCASYWPRSPLSILRRRQECKVVKTRGNPTNRQKARQRKQENTPRPARPLWRGPETTPQQEETTPQQEETTLPRKAVGVHGKTSSRHKGQNRKHLIPV